MKNKLKISDLSVKSFVTELREKSENNVRGGGCHSDDQTNCRACVTGPRMNCEC